MSDDTPLHAPPPVPEAYAKEVVQSSKLIKSPIGWTEMYLGVARVVASKSKDPNTKVGAVIVDEFNRPCSFGYNGFPNGVLDYEWRWQRPIKYDYVVHAEENAILNAQGRNIRGATIYITHFPPCQRCAGTIVQSGIKRIICGSTEISKHSAPQCVVSFDILREAGIELLRYDFESHLLTKVDLTNLAGNRETG